MPEAPAWFTEEDELYPFEESAFPHKFSPTGSWIKNFQSRTMDMGGDTGLVEFRSFPATDLRYGVWSDTWFPRDGGAPIRIVGDMITMPTVYFHKIDGYPSVLRCNSSLVKKGAPGYHQSIKLHKCVAPLWGAQNDSGLPVSDAQTVDHLEGDKGDWSVDKLRLVSNRANVQARFGITEMVPYAFEESAFPHKFSPTGSWIKNFQSRTMDMGGDTGLVEFRSFPATDSREGLWSDTWFPRNGGVPIRIVGSEITMPVVSYTRQDYPYVQRTDSSKKKGSSGYKRVAKLHKFVAQLWGAQNDSGMPMCDAQCVDHLHDNKNDWSVDELRLVSLRKNSRKRFDAASNERSRVKRSRKA